MATTRHKIKLTAFDKTKAAFSSVKRGLGTVTKSVFSLRTALAAVIGIGGFGALIKSSLSSADALAKTADKLGITTQALGGLQHAAELSGVSTQTFNMAMQRMTRRVSEAALGTGEAKDAIKELGLNAQKLAAMGPDQAMNKIADAMANVSNQGDRVRLAMKLFDSEGVALVNTLGDGAEKLREAQKEAEALGVTLSRVDAAKIEQANDAWFKMKQAITGVANRIAVSFAPYLQAIATMFFNNAKASNGFQKQVTTGLDNIKKAIGVILDALRYLSIGWTTVKLGAVAAIDGIVRHALWLDQTLASVINKLPGLSWTPSADLPIWAAASKLAVDDVAQSLEKLLTEPMPSEGLAETFANVEQMARQHAIKLAQIREQQQSQQARSRGAWLKKEAKENKFYTGLKDKTLVGGMVHITKGVAQQSKALFQINKAAAIAGALLDTREAVSAAYKWGAKIGGPAVGAAMGALAFGAQMAQVSAIRGTSFDGGGGGTTPSAAGSSAVINDTPIDSSPGEPVAGTAKEVTIHFRGIADKEAIRDIMDQISEESLDGVPMKVNVV